MRVLLVLAAMCLASALPAAVVAGPGAGGPIAKAAVADLARLLGETADLRVGQPADFPEVRVGPPLAKDEIALRAVDGRLYVLGGSDQAVSDAVYTLLDRLGCRWYLPGEIGEVIPARLDLAGLGKLEVRERPAFAWRHPWCAFGFSGEYGSQAAAKRWNDWYRRNRCGGDYVWMSHNLLTPLPPEQYFREHPEYYALVNGQRKASQPCTSNPALLPIYVAAINRYFDEHPEAPAYSLSPEDNADFCQCDACRAQDSGRLDPGFGNRPVVTDRLTRFFEAVSAQVQERHPGKFVTFYAYFNHTLPPTTVRLDDGVGVGLTAQQFCSIHGVQDETCESRQKMRRILEEYTRQTPHVYIREYDPAPYTAGLPFPLYLSHPAELRVYRQMGVRGFSIEGHKAWASTFPNYFFYARALWDPAFDESATLSAMCHDLYGPAAAPMERYYRLLAGAFAHSAVHPNWGLSEYAAVWQPETVRQLGEAVRAAEAAGGDAAVRERVLYVRLEYNYLADYLQVVSRSKQGDLHRMLAAAARAKRTIETQHRLNEDLVLLPEARQRLERVVMTARHDWMGSDGFKRANEVACALPAVWSFRRDPADEGRAAGWQRPGLDPASWRPIRIDRQWYAQVGEEMTGVGWARTTFTVPPAFQGRRLVLHVGALDERGTIYLNGEPIVERYEGLLENAWQEPFDIDVTGKVRLGEINTLVVRAEAEGTLGGLWRGALIYSPRQ